MAISPPSDILLDVARAADPVKVRAATERLAKLAADPAAANEGFSKALTRAAHPDVTGEALVAEAKSSAPTSEPRPGMRAMSQGKNDTYQKFEAMMLQNFVESMLPQSDELYGDKASADSYRSMMAEQLANQIAKAGGIGIAKAVEHAHPQTGTIASTITTSAAPTKSS